MSRSIWYVTTAVLALAGATGIVKAAGSGGPVASSSTPSAARIRDLDIEFYRARTVRDPRSARDFTQLAALYLQRARETADNADLVRAEETARQSLALRRGRNDEAVGVLASSLMAQHRFDEAHDAALELLRTDSTSIPARGMVAEAAMELGRYDEAARLFGMLETYQSDLGTAPRLARWAELRGDSQEARRLLREALEQARRRHGMPREQLAWFHLRLGDLALRTGHLGEAERQLNAGLSILPDDYRLLGTLARLQAARHRWRDGRRDRGARGRPRARPGHAGPPQRRVARPRRLRQGERVRSRHGPERPRQPGAYHRAWSLYLLDHGREVETVLANVTSELETRRDIYGYDLLAWALHASGRNEEARAPMARALELGTQDAMLYYHAGMIALATGDTAAARSRLRHALAINSWWHPTQPGRARAVLDSLSR